jgi:drug/metabolite transporter (DMT)-like permease
MAGLAVDIGHGGIRSRRLQGALAFLIVYIVWGSTFLAIRFAVETIPPFLTAGTRHLIAGSILLAWAWWRGERPSGQAWRMGIVLGFLFFLVGHGTLHWAEQHVPSGVAALVVATEPVFVAWMLPLFRLGSAPGAKTYVGLALGVASVAVLFGPDVTGGGGDMVIGLAAVLLGSISWAAGIVLSRKLQERRDGVADTSTMNAALPLLCGSFMLLAGGVARGEHDLLSAGSVSTLSLLGLLYLVFFGSLVAFTAYSWLLKHYPPTLVATHTYVNPIVALILGWLLAAEKITVSIVASAALAIAAIALVSKGEASVGRAPSETDPLPADPLHKRSGAG